MVIIKLNIFIKLNAYLHYYQLKAYESSKLIDGKSIAHTYSLYCYHFLLSFHHKKYFERSLLVLFHKRLKHFLHCAGTLIDINLKIVKAIQFDNESALFIYFCQKSKKAGMS